MKLVVEVKKDTYLIFKEEENGKLSFSSNSLSLTSWINNCSKKEVCPKEKYRVICAAKEWLEKNASLPSKSEVGNPIIELAELVQRLFGESITTEVTGKLGSDHCPIVSVRILLPDGREYLSHGQNQRVAKQDAARMALADIDGTNK